MSDDQHRIPIWFFIGVTLFVMGLLITGFGLFAFATGVVGTTTLANLHPELWWGGLLVVIGGWYTWRFRPFWR